VCAELVSEYFMKMLNIDCLKTGRTFGIILMIEIRIIPEAALSNTAQASVVKSEHKQGGKGKRNN
jgi:hypothetical protein